MAEHQLDWTRPRVLLIEDDPDQQKLLSHVLRRERMEVTACGSVEDALQLVAQQQFAVAVVDLSLPGQSGIQFARELSRLKHKTRIVIHTGHATFESAKEGLNLGAFAYVEKIGDFTQLLDHVRRAATDYLSENLTRAEHEIQFQLRLLDAVEQGVVATDLEGQVIYWNRCAERLLGWSPQQTLGRQLSDVMPLKAWRGGPIAARLASGRSWSGELQVQLSGREVAEARTSCVARSGGRPATLPVRLTASPILDSHGMLAGYIGAFSDITREKQVSNELKVHARRQAVAARLGLLALSETSLDKLLEVLAGTVSKALDGDGCEILEWVAQDQLFHVRATAGSPCGHTQAAAMAEARSQVARTFSTGQPIAVEDYCPAGGVEPDALQGGGQPRSGLTVPVIGADTTYGVLAFYSSRVRRFATSEIEFAKLLSNILASAIDRQRLLNRWQSLFNNSLDLILLLDDQRQIIGANSAACEALGYRHEQLMTMRIDDLVPAAHRTQTSEMFHAFLAHGKLEGEMQFARADGRTMSVEHRGAANVVPGLHLVDCRDVTESKHAAEVIQEQRNHLAHVQRVTTLGQMASVLAHEINQPLGAISNYAGGLSLALRKTSIPNPNLLETLEQINQQALRAGEIVRRLRRLSSPGGARPTLLDLNQVVQETLRLMRGDLVTRQVTVQLRLADGLPGMSGDAIQLQQVLVNLLKNAAEAMERVPVEQRVVELQTQLQAGGLLLVVSDNGPPVPEEVLRGLFEPYFSTKTEGLGMGLCISRSIIEQHQGEIRALPNTARGVRFEIELPVFQDELSGGVPDDPAQPSDALEVRPAVADAGVRTNAP
jgi:PAS domain S-box-containing protein